MIAAMATEAEITVRHLASDADYRACLDLQQAIWGEELLECVPPRIQKISQLVGGVAAGAFAADGRLLGFVWGLTGVRKGRLAHWSHMLGVLPEARDLGLGRRLKQFQRESLLALGVEAVYWTFDPLESRNAHLNFNRLGVGVDEYVRDYYGAGETSHLHRGIGTDRFIVVWELAGERAAKAAAGHLPEAPEQWDALPVANAELDANGVAAPVARPLADAPALRVEVPASIQRLKAEHPELAARWRAGSRRAFEAALARGWTVRAFYHAAGSDRSFYVLG